MVKFGMTLEASFDGYQASLVEFEIEGGVVEVADLPNVKAPQISYAGGVIISGRGPVWLYAHLVHEYHPARWVGVNDPRLGYVVVSRHHPDAPAVGTVLDPKKVTV
jgi:CRISPR-associated protein Csx3